MTPHNMCFSFVLSFVLFCGCTFAALNCPTLPPHPLPTNVSYLRPADIKVVMAMGDSITAGFGIHGAPGGLNESRGLSYSIGGDSNATTMATFLRVYSPNLQGLSLGQHFVEYCGEQICPPFQYHPAEDVLNSAQSGAVAIDLASHELGYLLEQMRANPKINMKEDWKLLTIFIGGNDLCASCENKTFLQPDEYEATLTKTLEAVRTKIPRIFVQVVEIFNVSQVYELSLKSPRCADIHRFLPIECPCVFDKDANASRLLVDEYATQYNVRTRIVAARYQALNYPEFAVTVQPFFRDVQLSQLPLSILSTLDCFHPSQYGHEVMGIALWNNLLTPSAYKKTTLNISDTPLCPTADTLLYTY